MSSCGVTFANIGSSNSLSSGGVVSVVGDDLQCLLYSSNTAESSTIKPVIASVMHAPSRAEVEEEEEEEEEAGGGRSVFDLYSFDIFALVSNPRANVIQHTCKRSNTMATTLSKRVFMGRQTRRNRKCNSNDENSMTCGMLLCVLDTPTATVQPNPVARRALNLGSEGAYG
eukprot:gene15480-biopygen4291